MSGDSSKDSEAVAAEAIPVTAQQMSTLMEQMAKHQALMEQQQARQQTEIDDLKKQLDLAKGRKIKSRTRQSRTKAIKSRFEEIDSERQHKLAMLEESLEAESPAEVAAADDADTSDETTPDEAESQSQSPSSRQPPPSPKRSPAAPDDPNPESEALSLDHEVPVSGPEDDHTLQKRPVALSMTREERLAWMEQPTAAAEQRPIAEQSSIATDDRHGSKSTSSAPHTSESPIGTSSVSGPSAPIGALVVPRAKSDPAPAITQARSHAVPVLPASVTDDWQLPKQSRVWAWGGGDSTVGRGHPWCVPLGPLTHRRLVSVSAGASRAALLTSTGDVYMWEHPLAQQPPSLVRDAALRMSSARPELGTLPASAELVSAEAVGGGDVSMSARRRMSKRLKSRRDETSAQAAEHTMRLGTMTSRWVLDHTPGVDATTDPFHTGPLAGPLAGLLDLAVPSISQAAAASSTQSWVDEGPARDDAQSASSGISAAEAAATRRAQSGPVGSAGGVSEEPWVHSSMAKEHAVRLKQRVQSVAKLLKAVMRAANSRTPPHGWGTESISDLRAVAESLESARYAARAASRAIDSGRALLQASLESAAQAERAAGWLGPDRIQASSSVADEELIAGSVNDGGVAGSAASITYDDAASATAATAELGWAEPSTELLSGPLQRARMRAGHSARFVSHAEAAHKSTLARVAARAAVAAVLTAQQLMEDAGVEMGEQAPGSPLTPSRTGSRSPKHRLPRGSHGSTGTQEGEIVGGSGSVRRGGAGAGGSSSLAGGSPLVPPIASGGVVVSRGQNLRHAGMDDNHSNVDDAPSATHVSDRDSQATSSLHIGSFPPPMQPLSPPKQPLGDHSDRALAPASAADAQGGANPLRPSHADGDVFDGEAVSSPTVLAEAVALADKASASGVDAAPTRTAVVNPLGNDSLSAPTAVVGVTSRALLPSSLSRGKRSSLTRERDVIEAQRQVNSVWRPGGTAVDALTKLQGAAADAEAAAASLCRAVWARRQTARRHRRPPPLHLLKGLVLHRVLRGHAGRVVQVACGEKHCLARTAAGEVFSWGAGSFGRLGHGSDDNEGSPRLVMHLLQAGFQASWVAVGRRHSAAVGRDGSLWTWGSGKFGKLGHGDASSKLLPTWIRNSGAGSTDPWHREYSSSSWVASGATSGSGSGGAGNGIGERAGSRQGVAAGGPASRLSGDKARSRGNTAGAAVSGAGGSSSGGIFGWLLGSGGSSGGRSPSQERAAKPLDPAEEWTRGVRVWKVACGFSHTVAISRRGRVFAWGSNDSGQVGLPPAQAGKNAFTHPQAVQLPEGVGLASPVSRKICASTSTRGDPRARTATGGGTASGSVVSELPEHGGPPRLLPTPTAPTSGGTSFSTSRSASNILTSVSNRSGTGHVLSGAASEPPVTPLLQPDSAARVGGTTADSGAVYAAEQLVQRVKGCATIAVRWSEWRPGRGANDVACGSAHTVISTADGACVAWGRDTHGQTSGRPTGYVEHKEEGEGVSPGVSPAWPLPPRTRHSTQVLPISAIMTSAGAEAYAWANVVSVAAGDSHSVVTTASGAVIAIGHNARGQLGSALLADESIWTAAVHLPGRGLWSAPTGGHSPDHAVLWEEALSGRGGNAASITGATSPASPFRPSPMSAAYESVPTGGGGGGGASLVSSPVHPSAPSSVTGEASRGRAPSQASVETSGTTDRVAATRARTTAALLDARPTGLRVRRAALQMAARCLTGTRSIAVSACRDVTFVLEGVVPACGFRSAEHASSLHRDEVFTTRSLMEGDSKSLLDADAAAGDSPEVWAATINESVLQLQLVADTKSDWATIRSVATLQQANRAGKLADLLLQCGGVPPPLRPRLYPLLTRNQAHVTPVFYRECLRRGRALVAGMLRSRVHEHIGRLRGKAKRLARNSDVILSPTGIVSPVPKHPAAANRAGRGALQGRQSDPFWSPAGSAMAEPARPARLNLAAIKHSAAVVRAGTPEGSPLLRSANSLGLIRAPYVEPSSPAVSPSARSDRRLYARERSNNSLYSASEGGGGRTPIPAHATGDRSNHRQSKSTSIVTPATHASQAPSSSPITEASSATPLGAWAETFLIGTDDAAPAEADAAAALEAFFDSGPNAEGSGSEGGGPLAFLLGDASDTSTHHGTDASVIGPASGSDGGDMAWANNPGAMMENTARMDPAEAAGALALLSRGLAGPGAQASAGPSLDEQQRMDDVTDICKDLGRTFTGLHLFDVGGPLRRDMVEVVVALMGAFVDFGYSQAMMWTMAPLLAHTGSPYLTFQLYVNFIARPEMRMLFRASDSEARRGFLRLCLKQAQAERLPRDEEHDGTYIVAWLQTMFTQQVSFAQASAALDFCLANGADALLALVLAAHRLLSKELFRMGGGSKDSLAGGEGVAEEVLNDVFNGGRAVWQRVLVGKNLAKEAAMALRSIPARDISELRSLLRNPFLLAPAGKTTTSGPFESAPHPAFEASSSTSIAESVRGGSVTYGGAATAASVASGMLRSVAEEEESASAPGGFTRRGDGTEGIRHSRHRTVPRAAMDVMSLGSAARSGGLRSIDGDDLGEDMDLSQMPGILDGDPSGLPGLPSGEFSSLAEQGSSMKDRHTAAATGRDGVYTPTGDNHSEITDEDGGGGGDEIDGGHSARQAKMALAEYSAYKEAHSEDRRIADAAKAKPAPPDAFRDI